MTTKSTVTITTKRTVTIAAPLQIDADELWSRIWGSEPQAAGSHWHGLRFMTGDWDEVGQVRVVLEDLDDEDKRIDATITMDKIVDALNDPAFPAHLRQNIMDDNADCIDSDAVIQHIVYGEVVFG